MRTKGIAAEAYPLTWPPGRPRTTAHKRARARFHAQRKQASEYNPGGYRTLRESITMAAARDELIRELSLLRCSQVVLSTNVELRRDGLPMSGRRTPDDTGAAVYFVKDGEQLCFACDRWDRVEDNIVAIGKTIEALRGIDRWGTGDMIRAAFAGFQAIAWAPPAIREAWWTVLGCESHTPTEEVEKLYRTLAGKHHPDRHGDPAKLSRINDAWEDFRQERGL